MNRSVLMLAVLTAACGGRASAPATAPAPVTTAPAAAAEPSTLRYAAGPGRYRVESNVRITREMMGNTQDQDANTTMLVSTTLNEESGQLLLSATVDSIAVTGSPEAASALSAARGRSFRARFSPLGRPVRDSAAQGDVIEMQIGRSIREFLAVLPASLSAGTTWTDTVTEEQPIPDINGRISTRSIRQNRLVGWETRDGVRALHIATTGTYTITGSGDAGGQALELNGTGNATAERWVSAAGVYLGATASDSSNLTVTVTSVGMTIPIRQVQRTTVTRLP